MKAETERKIAKPILAYACEFLTITKRQKNKQTSMEMRFLRRIEEETRIYKISNKFFRVELRS